MKKIDSIYHEQKLSYGYYESINNNQTFNDLKTESGFTLVEILVVMSIFVFLMVTSTDFIIKGIQSSTFGFEQDTAVSNARKSLDPLAKEIREATPAATGNYSFASTTDQSLSFYANVDSDVSAEKIRYYLVGSDLFRGVTKATGSPLTYPVAEETSDKVVDYINNQTEPIFTYFDTNNNLIPNPIASTSAIRMIHIRLKINVTPAIAPGDYVVDTDVQIRNLKDNL